MYGKFEQIEDAKLIFTKVQHRDTVCWKALIAVLSQNRNDDEALCLFHEMQSVLEAKSMFEQLCSRDVISWNTMQNGQAANAMESFKRMLAEHIHPDEITFVCYSACSHAGCLDIGKYYLHT